MYSSRRAEQLTKALSKNVESCVWMAGAVGGGRQPVYIEVNVTTPASLVIQSGGGDLLSLSMIRISSLS